MSLLFPGEYLLQYLALLGTLGHLSKHTGKKPTPEEIPEEKRNQPMLTQRHVKRSTLGLRTAASSRS
jgi:hypothetical protein